MRWFFGRSAPVFRLNARRGTFVEMLRWRPRETAVIICDVWDDHRCRTAAQRCAQLAPRINDFATIARKAGSLIVHCPGGTMAFYDGTTQRKGARDAATVRPPVRIVRRSHRDPSLEPELPIDDSDGGCDDGVAVSLADRPMVLTREHPAIMIADGDAVTDDGREVYNLFAASGIRNVLITGVHTNKCVLERSYGIRQMVLLGMRTLLVRDLTDSLYNPAMRPYVSHDRGTELVVAHIEQYLCPSILSYDLATL